MIAARGPWYLVTMKWERARRSSNVEDRRGRGAKVGAGIGLVAIIGAVIALIAGKNPADVLKGLASQPQAPAPTGSASDEDKAFVESILGETEDVWGEIFKKRGKTYPQPKLVLFTGQVSSACGKATSAVGPFYCPGDHQMYIDLSFFDLMKKRLGGGGDFAQAYVLAHEVGHHVQTVEGVSERVDAMRRAGKEIEGADGPLVRQELQADCYAGVWANQAQKRHDWLVPGDIEEALSTAAAIGDDRLQKQAKGTVVPDSFTHGTSAQRVRWFKIGFETGDPARCDTFAATSL
jgi:predicted metalloprotease